MLSMWKSKSMTGLTMSTCLKGIRIYLLTYLVLFTKGYIKDVLIHNLLLRVFVRAMKRLNKKKGVPGPPF